MSGVTEMGNTYKNKSITLYSGYYYSSCKFVDCVLTTENKQINDLYFRACTFCNCAMADIHATKDRMIDCMFYGTRFENINMADFLISAVTFNNSTFRNFNMYKNDLFNCIISETREVKNFKMNTCKIIGGSIPPNFMSKLDLIATIQSTISDVFQSPDVEHTVPNYSLQTGISVQPNKEKYVPVTHYFSKKPWLFMSEDI